MSAGGVIFLIVVILVVVHITRQAKKYDQAWRGAGKTLGLRPDVAGILGTRALSGKVAGLKVHVDTGTIRKDGAPKPVTRYRVHYPSLRLHLVLKRQHPRSLPARRQDIEVGDAPFDSAVVVQGRDPAAVRAFLTPERRLRILRAFKTFASCVITDTYVRCAAWKVEDQPERLQARMRMLVDLARSLTGGVARPGPLARAEKARRRGDLGTALKETADAVREKPEDVVARAAEAEVLYSAGRYEQAKQRLEEVESEAPGDPEVPLLAEEAQRRVEALPPEPVPPAPEQDQEQDDDAHAACEALFGAGLSSVEIERLFEQEFNGRRVRWSGRLESAVEYASDFVFGTEPGTRAVVLLHAVEQDYFGEQEVRAVLRLPPGRAEKLETRAGETIAFKGRLVRIDPFVRNLFLDAAAVE